MDRENFSFEQWCASYELNEDTVKTLEKRGHKSHLSISVMVIDEIKKDFKALLPAQILLLEKAVRDFQAAQTRHTDTPTDTSSSDTMPTPSGSVVPKHPCPTSVEDVLHHQVGFRWGTSSHTLMQTHLQTNINLPQNAATQTQPREPHSGRIICSRWNSVQGCPLYACKFLHVCRTCFSDDHPHHRHHSTQVKNRITSQPT